jgi:hypothetical protein
MGFVIDMQEVARGKLRITLRGGQAFVTQKFLYGTQISAFFEQVRAESVAQGVRVNICRQATRNCNPLDNAPDTAGSEAVAVTKIYEQGAVVQLVSQREDLLPLR